jgi:hypothetical protein
VTRRLWTTLRTVALALALVIAFGFVAGARPVYAYRELRCSPGFTAQPVSIAPVYQCRPAIPDPTAIQWPQVVATQHEIGLYLANLRIRVFHFDFVWGTTYWFAFDVPSPPYG